MLRRSSLAPILACTALFAFPLAAQDHGHAAQAANRLGTVHFETSCAPAAAPGFDRGIAQLHSFEFAAAIREFEGVLKADSTCAMAWWGIARSRWGNPMVPNIRPPAVLQQGREAVAAAERVWSGATERERDYIRAVGMLYNEPERDQKARLTAYEESMEALAAKHPDDTEAQIFHAISVVGIAAPSDKTYAHQLKAGAILEKLFQEQPDHPGLAHYIIHSYDVPALAERASAAAERYADIAPAAAHALHMPSHTFTRVGMWDQSIGTNLRSMEVAQHDAPGTADWMEPPRQRSQANTPDFAEAAVTQLQKSGPNNGSADDEAARQSSRSSRRPCRRCGRFSRTSMTARRMAL